MSRPPMGLALSAELDTHPIHDLVGGDRAKGGLTKFSYNNTQTGSLLQA